MGLCAATLTRIILLIGRGCQGTEQATGNRQQGRHGSFFFLRLCVSKILHVTGQTQPDCDSMQKVSPLGPLAREGSQGAAEAISGNNRMPVALVPYVILIAYSSTIC